MATPDIQALTAAINNLVQMHMHQEQLRAANPLPSASDLYNQLSTRIDKYTFGTGEDTKAFSKWLLRHEFTLVVESTPLPLEMRTRLILDKLGQVEFERLVDHVAPHDPSKMRQETH